MDIGNPHGNSDIERDLDCLVGSAWPTIFSLVMNEIKSLKIRVSCKYSITVVHWHNNTPLVGEKRLEIEKQLKNAHPSLVDDASECLTIEWREDVPCLGNPFTVSKRDAT
jgi:hypothetical protein